MKKILIWLFLVLTTIGFSSCWKTINNTDNLSVSGDIAIQNLHSVWVSDFKNELEKNDWVILDIRTIWELKQTWIISWANHMDFYKSNFKDKLGSLDKNEKYLIYCRSWNRSWNALNTMKELWFTNVVELDWWINSWITSWEDRVSF